MRKIPFTLNPESLKTGPMTPIRAYGERFHHRPSLWYYRWTGEEKIDALCRKALEQAIRFPDSIPIWPILFFWSKSCEKMSNGITTSHQAQE